MNAITLGYCWVNHELKRQVPLNRPLIESFYRAWYVSFRITKQ